MTANGRATKRRSISLIISALGTCALEKGSRTQLISMGLGVWGSGFGVLPEMDVDAVLLIEMSGPAWFIFLLSTAFVWVEGVQERSTGSSRPPSECDVTSHSVSYAWLVSVSGVTVRDERVDYRTGTWRYIRSVIQGTVVIELW